MAKLLLRAIAPIALLGLVAPSASAVSSLNLTGTIRDFNASGSAGGHPDFEFLITGLDQGIVQPTLGSDRIPVYAGLAGNPSTNGQEFFDQWYRDVPGVNLSAPFTITLTDPDENGVFTFESESFFPIDNQLLGNQGEVHNFHFTYAINSAFTYSGGEVFTFTGDDDVFVFINNQLVIDLGGVHGALTASVSLDAVADSIGLVVGETFNFDFFFAERHTTLSNFRIDTSIVLEQPPEVVPEPALGLLSLSILGLGWRSQRSLTRSKDQ